MLSLALAKQHVLGFELVILGPQSHLMNNLMKRWVMVLSSLITPIVMLASAGICCLTSQNFRVIGRVLVIGCAKLQGM